MRFSAKKMQKERFCQGIGFARHSVSQGSEAWDGDDLFRAGGVQNGLILVAEIWKLQLLKK